jgi:hypothetical protein
MLKFPSYYEVIYIVKDHLITVLTDVIATSVAEVPYNPTHYFIGQVQFLTGVKKTLEASFKNRPKRDSKVAWSELRSFLYSEAGRYTFRMGYIELPSEYIRGYDKAQMELIQDFEIEFGIPTDTITSLDDLDAYQLVTDESTTQVSA